MNRSPTIAFLAAVLILFRATASGAEEEVISHIKREPVVSTNVASIGYSRHLRALEIEFTRGAIYRFLDVPPIVYREVMSARSKGHFIATNIRGRYAFQRVRAAHSGHVARPPRER